jgi:hypothetical protein
MYVHGNNTFEKRSILIRVNVCFSAAGDLSAFFPAHLFCQFLVFRFRQCFDTIFGLPVGFAVGRSGPLGSFSEQMAAGQVVGGDLLLSRFRNT